MFQPQTRKFLELTVAGVDKKLYIPSDAVLTYEVVPKGKNEHFPNEGSFLRYDYGEGLMFAIVTELIDQLKTEIGTEGFLALHLIDDVELYLRQHLIVAIQEKHDEDTDTDATQISIMLSGQIGSLFVKDTFQQIMDQQN